MQVRQISPTFRGSNFILLLIGLSFLFQNINSNTEIDMPSESIHGLGAQPRTFSSPVKKAAPEEVRASSISTGTTDTSSKTKEGATRRLETFPTELPNFENYVATTAVLESSSQSNVLASRGVISPSSIPATVDSDDVINSRPPSTSTTLNASLTSASSTFHLLTRTHSRPITSDKYLESSMSTATSLKGTTTALPESDLVTIDKSDIRVADVVRTRSFSNSAGNSKSEISSGKEFLAPSFSASHPFLGSISTSTNQSRDSFWAISFTLADSSPGDVDVGGSSRPKHNGSEDDRGNSSKVGVAKTTMLEFAEENTVELTTATVMVASMVTEYLRNEIPLQPSSDSQVRKEEFVLPAGTVAGIVVASIGFVCILAAVLGLFVFRRFRGLHSKTYENKYNGDNCSYLDSLQVSYINNHIELPKESSDEMLSLDNDSFLNSLEAMTMENYWAEDRGSTKV